MKEPLKNPTVLRSTNPPVRDQKVDKTSHMRHFKEQQTEMQSINLFLEEIAVQHRPYLVSNEPIKSIKSTAVKKHWPTFNLSLKVT